MTLNTSTHTVRHIKVWLGLDFGSRHYWGHRNFTEQTMGMPKCSTVLRIATVPSHPRSWSYDLVSTDSGYNENPVLSANAFLQRAKQDLTQTQTQTGTWSNFQIISRSIKLHVTDWELISRTCSVSIQASCPLLMASIHTFEWRWSPGYSSWFVLRIKETKYQKFQRNTPTNFCFQSHAHTLQWVSFHSGTEKAEELSPIQ